MREFTRREAMGTIITAGAGITLAGLTEAAAQTPAAPAFSGQHQINPLPFDPAKLKGISEKLIRSHAPARSFCMKSTSPISAATVRPPATYLKRSRKHLAPIGGLLIASFGVVTGVRIAAEITLLLAIIVLSLLAGPMRCSHT